MVQLSQVHWLSIYIQKFPDWVDNEITNKQTNKHSFRSNTKGYDDKTH
jgi:hypothetical protein